ncbi:Z-DNA-binding protein 1 isoform X1 [Saccopteryx leptura]|uniref:Z-DNA-binding protein 1 isoform X1 n=1 Tax=Saccopteryx leptura TaxID=249018 RepID=UPI00339BCE7E
MAQAADPGGTDLEQKILQVLRDAGSPVKTAQLAKECQVTKKKVNQVLYRMKEELQVASVGLAMWCLGEGGTGETAPTKLARPSHVERPQRDTVAVQEKHGSQLTEQQERIYTFLESGGPCKALVIAKSLGMKTAKEVNPDLYTMKEKRLLDYDKNARAWAIYQPEASREISQSTTVIYQQNPLNMICQNGPNSHISVQNSEAIQIGHGNIMVRQTASGEHGSTVPLYLPPPAPADPSTQGSLAESWGSQDICVERSVLRRVQLGHSNEMTLHSTLATDPGQRPSISPPVSAATDGPDSSFETPVPTPGPHSEGKEDVAQRVCISFCSLEETTIGNSNRMRVSLGAAGLRGGAEPEVSSRSPGEPTEATAPQSEAAEPRGELPHDAGQADPDMSTFTAHLEAVTLESRGPDATEDGP